jgi:ribosome-binding ATPase YchF (GTP1/OBG family)
MLAGIIGKPNVGKSSFFNAATLLNVPVANYPFTTINPNFGVGYIRVPCVHREMGVKDKPVNSSCVDGNRLIPVRLVDVAGLVPGASQGRGLGNKFLDDLRQADALIHVVDVSGSTDEEGRQVNPGTHDPAEDIEFVGKEFTIWMEQIISKDWGVISRSAEARGERVETPLAGKLSGLGIKESEVQEATESTHLSNKKPTTWTKNDLFGFVQKLRNIAKPTVIAANKVDLKGSAENLQRLQSSATIPCVPCAAEGELLLRRASQAGLIDYIPGDASFTVRPGASLTSAQMNALRMVRQRVLDIFGSTGVQQTINKAYLDLLHGIVVYPVEDESKLSDKKGNVLPDARIMRKGDTAKDLAYSIHTDLGSSFLYAVDAKSGIRLGADYPLKDGDVIKVVATSRRA